MSSSRGSTSYNSASAYVSHLQRHVSGRRGASSGAGKLPVGRAKRSKQDMRFKGAGDEVQARMRRLERDLAKSEAARIRAEAEVARLRRT